MINLAEEMSPESTETRQNEASPAERAARWCDGYIDALLGADMSRWGRLVTEAADLPPEFIRVIDTRIAPATGLLRGGNAGRAAGILTDGVHRSGADGDSGGRPRRAHRARRPARSSHTASRARGWSRRDLPDRRPSRTTNPAGISGGWARNTRRHRSIPDPGQYARSGSRRHVLAARQRVVLPQLDRRLGPADQS